MKQLICLFCSFVLSLSLCSCKKDYTHAIYNINIFTECIYNQSVGNEWEETFKMDDKSISNNEQIILPLDVTTTKTIVITIREKDKYSDVSSKEITIDLKNAETKTTFLIIRENNGRYKGNEAKWKITISVELIKKIERDDYLKIE